VSVAIEVQELIVEADGKRLLGPLAFALEEGEHALVVGPSGAGKTTLLRALAGLITPSAGRIELFGVPASAPGRVMLPPEERGVGYVFQGAALWPHLSVERTLLFVLACHGVRGADARQRVRALVEQVRLTGLEPRLPATLSGGEKQRLALARAMAVEPRLLFLDEPLGPLDVELRSELLDLIDELHTARGWTTVHVTHDPGEAARVAGRVLRLAAGTLVQERP